MMTQEEIAELVRRLRHMSAVWNDNRNLLEAADALEQQAREVAALKRESPAIIALREEFDRLRVERDGLRRELAACEGALRNSGNMVRDLNNLAKRYE